MFELNGRNITLDELKTHALSKNMDFEEYMRKMQNAGLKNVSNEKPGVVGEIKKIPGLDIMLPGVDRYVAPYLFDFILGVEDIAEGTIDILNVGAEKALGVSREQQLENKRRRELERPKIFTAIETFDKLVSNKYIDETGRELDVADLARSGKYGYMGELGLQSAMRSAPSTVMSVINPVFGGAILGASTAGGKYYEDLKNRPDETSSNILFNSLLAGGSEWGTEILGGKYLRGLGSIGKGAKEKAFKEYTKGFVNKFFSNVLGGGFVEAGTEALNAVIQETGNVLFYEDDISKKKYIDHIINATVPAFIMGGKGGVIASGFTQNNKQNLYKLAATNKWKQEYFSIGKQIHDTALDLENANPSQYEALKQELDNLIKARDKKVNELTESFENLTNKEFIQYGKNLDKIVKNNNILNDVDMLGRAKFSSTAREKAEKENIELLQENYNLVGKEYTDAELEIEKIVGEALQASEIIEQRLKKLKGINRDDLDVKILESQEQIDKLIEEGDINFDEKADGIFVGKNEKGKAQIYINKQAASLAGATNVVGHELLHYMISRQFKTDNASMKPLIDELKSYLQENHAEVYGRLQQRIDKYYTNEDGTIKKGALEEYINVFSDLVSKEKIEIKDTKSKGLRNEFDKVLLGFGLKDAKIETAQDLVGFIKNFTENINTQGLLGKLMGTKILDARIESSKLQKIDDTDQQIDDIDQQQETVKKKSMSAEQRAKVKEAVDKLGQVDSDGNNLREKGTGNFYYQAEADNIVKEIKEKGYLNALIRAQYKADIVPVNFVDDVITQLTPDIKNFKPEQNESLFGYLQGRIKFRAGDVYNKIYKKTEQEKQAKDVDDRTKEGEIKTQVAAETDTALEAFETEDISPAARARRKAEKAKPKVQKESVFRNKVGFKTGSQIYNEILDAAKKSLIRAYGKTQNIKDAAARERAVVEELQKEHNSLTSPLFKQIKNWLGYGKAQEVVAKGTKDIYLDNLREFREDIVKLISTADLVQIERLVAESDRVFTRYKETLTKIADVQKAVDNLQLPPDAINKIKKGQPVRLYEKIIPGETEIVDFADQPGSIPSKKDPTKMVRSGLKGTRKDGIAKNIVNGLVFDAAMEARQSEEVQSKAKEMDVDTKSVEQLSAALGRPSDVKFSISMGDMSNIISDIVVDKKKHARNFGKGDRQRRLAVTAIDDIIRNIDNEGVYSSLVPMFEDLKNNINLGLTFDEVINSTWNKHGYLFKDVASYQMNVEMFNGSLNKKHLTNLLGKAKRITEVQVNQIAFNDAIKDLQKNPTDTNIKKFLRQYSKQIRTAKFVYNGKTITKNIHVLDNIVKPIQKNNNFGIKTVSKGKQRITFKGEELFTYQNSTEVKEAFKNNDQEAVQKIIQTYQKESKEAIDFVEATLKSDKSIEVQKSIIKSFFADTDAGGRKIAKPGIMAFGISKTVLDHRVPINKVIQEIYKTADNPTSQNLKNLREFLENTRVNNIPKTVDTKLVELGFKTEGNMDVMNSPEVLELMEDVETKNYSNVKLSRSTKSESFNKAVMFSRSTNNPTQGITVLDFDDTLATTQSLVKFTRPDGTTGTLNAEQYASTYENLLDQGYTFDFSEFNKVVKGKVAPLFQKALKLQDKFGSKNMFVLTARPPAAQKAIFDFLKANGLNIPLKNITGLGNSTAEAKALWIAGKVGEGYNDFYFADDALQNVQAVKNMLDQFDVKSKVQQAKVKFSKSMDSDFNKILEEVTGIEAKKRFMAIKARKRGEKKGKFRFFIPPSHEDFVGLLYNFMGKGRRGDQHRNFFEQALVKPLNRAYREIDTAKQAIANDYKSLNKQFPDIKNKLRKKTPDGDFIFEDAVRIYLWNKHGYTIEGLSEVDQNNLVELVMNNPDLRQYAETVNTISKQDKYVEPGKGWEGGNIQTDLIDATGRVGRAKYFTEFNENADIIFSEDNLNKIEAGYGADFRSALEDMLHRISTGINRPKGQHATVNKFMNYLNGSVGTVMFFNVRSAILQQMSIVNYINFADNNIFAAAKAFANQKQYWKDFAFIFNSDMLKQRRGGIGTDINGADLAQAVAGSKNPSKMVVSYLLKLGFLPTQIGDNIAIATGGATFYRNRVNKYIKDGMSQKEAEAAAFTDFQDLTQSTQQSSRPDMTSQQQASWIGKLVLNFQNITSQYNRIIKKAALDIGKGRISPPYTSKTQSNLGNLSKILYYGGIQNVLFYSLQTALFAVMFDDDKDEDQILKKKERVINGTIDSILRGSGIYGAIASTLKNTLIKFKEQREKGYNKDESAVPMELLNFSPVVGIKIRQIVNAEKTLNYNENVISEMETFDADNPQWSAVTNYTQALTNFPANRLYQKSINMRNALDKDYTNFQRIMFFSGYTTWSLGLGDTEAVIEAKEKIKINKKNTKKSKKKKIMGKQKMGKSM